MPPTRVDTLVDQIITEMGPFMAHQRHKWAAQCQAFGLSMTHFQVLAVLDAEGPTPMGRLADELGVGLSNVSGIVGRLEEKGVVARVHDETDRRMVLAELTSAGTEMLEHVEDARLAHMRKLVELLSTSEQRTVLHALKTLTDAHHRVFGDHEDHGTNDHDKEPLHA
jgi:DNA-binding MarR family transcriptional regulator